MRRIQRHADTKSTQDPARWIGNAELHANHTRESWILRYRVAWAIVFSGRQLLINGLREAACEKHVVASRKVGVSVGALGSCEIDETTWGRRAQMRIAHSLSPSGLRQGPRKADSVDSEIALSAELALLPDRETEKQLQ